MTDTLLTLTNYLSGHGYICSYEYPGFLCLVGADRSWCFGFENGPLGYECMTNDGTEFLDVGESELDESSSILDLANYVMSIVR